MRAAIFQGPGKIEVLEVPDPVIQNFDKILKVLQVPGGVYPKAVFDAIPAFSSGSPASVNGNNCHSSV